MRRRPAVTQISYSASTTRGARSSSDLLNFPAKSSWSCLEPDDLSPSATRQSIKESEPAGSSSLQEIERPSFGSPR